MTVKVISEGPHFKIVTCSNCGALLEYTNADVKESIHRDYGGGSDTVRRIECPKCRDTVNVGWR